MNTMDRLRVDPEQLRWTLPPSQLGFSSTDEVTPCVVTPGQNRAVRALELGLALRGHGYNVYVAGDPGTNRSETVRYLLDRYQDPGYEPEDLCFVHNFHDPDRPTLLRFPAGRGSLFREAIRDAVERLREGIPRIFQSDVYLKRRRARVKRYSTRMDELATPLRNKAADVGLVLVQVEMGEHTEAELLPLVDNEPVAFEDLEAKVDASEFPAEELGRLFDARDTLDPALRSFSEAAHRLVQEAETDLATLDQELARPYLNLVLSGVYQEHQDVAGVVDYLREVEAFLEGRLGLFRADEEENGDDEEESEDEETEASFRKLQVNLILDNTGRTARPVVTENNPTVSNLRGTVDREVRSNGMVVADFTHIKSGSMIQAHGGFLVLHVEDLDGEGRAWGVIKRTLRTGQVQVETEDAAAAPMPRALRPEAIPVDLKVILIGTIDLYADLLSLDPDFPKLFKVKAEFDTEMELGPQAITEYACMIRGICDQDQLPPYNAEGVAAVVEYGVRLAGHRSRITTRFTEVGDLVREAAFWAGRRHPGPIGSEDVHRALDERRARVNLIEEKTQRLIREGVILIDTEGSAVGQVNGLAVLDVGDHRFGRPTRITASVAAGHSGVANIERMARLSGSHHDKGILILTGYLGQKFAGERPLTLAASLTLEQSYDEVDGDSASTAEMFALLAALGEAPIRQDLAVTGSMNQKGQVQAVGGVNEKIEGFFELCAARGLTGAQGVVIPAPNLPHLMLRPGVVRAVREGKFHIYAIQHVEEGIELVTGVSAGKRGPDGLFPEGTLFRRVDERLAELAEIARAFVPWRTT
jgi:ATP-dependent Lon protease